MNGAAMNCRQDEVLHSQHRDSRGLRDARYHLQMNHPCEQNFLPHHSKAIQSDNILVDGSAEYLQRLHRFDTTLPASGNIYDPRSQVRWAQMRKPIDLPVPKFEKDENCVANHPVTDNANPNISRENLDLDTRIDLLIKSKALAGMHPIFSELIDSEDDSDDSLIGRPRKVSMSKKRKSLSHVETIVCENKDDDPDKPLSRPPSPFLSRATYLFWFNKAIELKEQAKAQEQALLEKATKKFQDNVTSVKSNHVETPGRENKSFCNSLLNEISKEMKEMIKQQFINEVLENTISNSIERWWGTEFVQQEQHKLLVGHNEKLLNEDENSFNQTYDKQEHNLNLNRCSTLIHPDKCNTASTDKNVFKESLSTLTSTRSHINNKSENKHKLISDKKQDEINCQGTLKVNIEHIKAGFQASTHLTSNASLSQDQAEVVLESVQNLDSYDLTDRDRKNPEETRPLKFTNDESSKYASDKSSKHETGTVCQNLKVSHGLKIASDESSKHESSTPVVGNSVIIGEEYSNITSLPIHDKQNVTRNHQPYSSNDMDQTVSLCQDAKKEIILTDNEVKVQEYAKNSVLNEEDSAITRQTCEDALESTISSHVQVEEKSINEISPKNIDRICDTSKDLI